MSEELKRLRKERVRQLEREGRKAIGFFKEGGKTKPISKKKPKQQKVVTKVVPPPAPAPVPTSDPVRAWAHGTLERSTVKYGVESILKNQTKMTWTDSDVEQITRLLYCLYQYNHGVGGLGGFLTGNLSSNFSFC